MRMKLLASGKRFAGLALLSVVCVVVYALLRLLKQNTYYDFLIWNLFLAWIPYVLSSVAAILHERFTSVPRLALTVIGIVWILFLPNAPYIVTDMIHLTILKSNYTAEGHLGLGFSYWNDFMVIMLFAWNGLLLGAVSMHQWHAILRVRTSSQVSWVCAALVSFLSAYGILLGREYRLNSWDLLTNPASIGRSVVDSLHPEALLFCGMFGLFIFAVYAMVYLLMSSAKHASSRL
ncbi:DUF1361 domain-containing protein [Paenibacillus validus]|uniref:DUF1361 domain-containing protein n=1 Tax=Paenibacillus validus TaxID=44253 RepID=UPI0013DEEC80|nr:DUF1361 domain-containing protein [Paenibacillus validus]MED4604328.1 DUF1361 domain-containing protein [Paenibacillus validus]MED4609792.1 DUF1361 domain-containing protein [Paenibacillus validus]